MDEQKASFEFEELEKKPEEEKVKQVFIEKRDQLVTEQITQEPKPEEQKFQPDLEDYTGLGELIIDTGNWILPRRYMPPFNQFSEGETMRINKYSEKVEKKYGKLHVILASFPEIMLGLTLIAAGADRQKNAQVVVSKK